MNPLGAFSFGKIIKTFIPGLIAAVAVLLTAELLYRISGPSTCAGGTGFWGCFFTGSLLRQLLADAPRATAFVAILIPVALMLGFFLNTVMWLCCNEWCRGWANRTMDQSLCDARQAFETDARFAFRAVVGGAADARRVHLGDFYLPIMDLDKLTSLRESYFSWFEFHFNSVGALVVTGIAYAITVLTLATRWSIGVSWLTHLIVPLAVLTAVGAFLVVSGLRNLRRYQEGFVWFVVGTLHFRA